MTEKSPQKLPATILFACGQNIVRSPMAAALMRHFYGDRVEVESVGITCGMPDGFVVSVMKEIGIDLMTHEPKSFGDLEMDKFESVIALAPEALERANQAMLDTSIEAEYWPIPDPTLTTGNREQRLEAYRGVRDLLIKKIRERFDDKSVPA